MGVGHLKQATVNHRHDFKLIVLLFKAILIGASNETHRDRVGCWKRCTKDVIKYDSYSDELHNVGKYGEGRQKSLKKPDFIQRFD